MGRDSYIRRIAGVPPFTNVVVREKTLRTVRLLKRQRRLLYERVGSARFSRPAIHDLDAVLENLVPARPGFFVEAGANDGFTASNTYFLERFKGWRGVLVEPIPALYEQCVRERPLSKAFNCALVAEGGPTAVSMVYRGPRSSLADRDTSQASDLDHLDWERTYKVTVAARTLSSVLDEAGVEEIDLLVVDVEGHEVEALRGLDLSRYTPKLMLIEHNGTQSELQALLGSDYEWIREPSPTDVLYRRVDRL